MKLNFSLEITKRNRMRLMYHFLFKLGQPFFRVPYLGLYVYDDVVLMFDTPKKQILIEPIFTSYGFDVFLSSTTNPTFNANEAYGCLYG